MMTIIEGVGDEVVYFVGFALLVMILALAWTSTSVSEHSLIRTAVLVIDRRRRSNINNNNNTTSNAVGVTNNNTEARNRTTNFINLRSVDRISLQRIASISIPSGTIAEAVVPAAEPENSTPVTDNSSAPSIGNQRFETSIVNSVEVSASTPANEGPLLHRSDEPQLRFRNVQGSERKSSLDCDTATLIASDNCFLKSSVVSNDPLNEDGPPVAENSEEQSIPSDGLPPTDGNIRVRLKFLNDTQKLVEARLVDQLGQFKRQHFPEELGNNKIVRLIFNGQLLQRDQETLQFYGLFDNCVVHCHISSSTSSPSAPVFSPRVELDLSRLMLPLFGLILGLIWCCRIQYRQYFTGTSTFALLCITGLFVMSIVALWLPARAGHVRG